MDYSKNVPNKCNHCKYYINKDILGFVPGRCSLGYCKKDTFKKKRGIGPCYL